MKKFFIYIIFILLLLTGCDNIIKDEQKNPLDEGAQVTTNSTSVNDKTIITYASGRDDTEAVLKIIDNYNKQSDKYLVKYQELPFDYSQRYNQIYSALSTDDLNYDVIETNFAWIPEFASLGFLDNISYYIGRDEINLENYLASSINSSTYENNIYAMPKNITTSLLYLRTDAVESAPKTWDELIQISKEVKETGVFKYSYLFSGRQSETLAQVALEFIYAYGGKIFDADGQINLQKEGIVSGLNKFYEIYSSDFVPKDIGKLSDKEADVRFIDGESVFLRSDMNTWIIGNKAKSKIYGKFSVGPLPSGDFGVSNVLDGYGLSIYSKSKNKEAAWDFIRYMSGEDAQKILAVQGGKMPVLLKTYQDKEVLRINPYFGVDKFTETINNAITRPKTTKYKKFLDMFQNELIIFIQGQKTAEELADSLELKLLTL